MCRDAWTGGGRRNPLRGYSVSPEPPRRALMGPVPSSIDTTVGWPLGPPTSRAVLPSGPPVPFSLSDGPGASRPGHTPGPCPAPSAWHAGLLRGQEMASPPGTGLPEQIQDRTPSYTGISDEEQITFHLGTCLY